MLTVENGYYPHYGKDPELLSLVPSNLKVIRTWERNAFPKLYRRILTSTVKKAGVTPKALQSKEAYKPSKLFSLLLRIRDDSLFFPDFHRGWVKPAIKAGEQIINAEKNIKLIFAGGHPWSVFLVGAQLKEEFHLPLVLDLRDPWTTHPAIYGRTTAKNKRLEKHLFQLADRIILATENMKKAYCQVYPGEICHKMLVIRNGFDPGIIELAESKSVTRDKMVIVHTGRLPTISSHILIALEKLKQESPKKINNIEFHFIGWIKDDFKKQVKEKELSDIVRFSAPTSLLSSIGYQKASDILLLVIEPGERSKQVLTGKLLEYIGAKKPIIALAPEESEAADLIKKEGIGTVVPPDNPQLIKQALLKYIDQWEVGELPRQVVAPHREDFSAENLTRKLAGVFDEVG